MMSKHMCLVHAQSGVQTLRRKLLAGPSPSFMPVCELRGKIRSTHNMYWSCLHACVQKSIWNLNGSKMQLYTHINIHTCTRYLHTIYVPGVLSRLTPKKWFFRKLWEDSCEKEGFAASSCKSFTVTFFPELWQGNRVSQTVIHMQFVGVHGGSVCVCMC